MRDKLVHDYMGIDLDKVWETKILDIPRLKEWISQIVEANDITDPTVIWRLGHTDITKRR